ncbi:MAG: hypothetical protein ABW061_08920 [Polyangiaceae bacterium]
MVQPNVYWTRLTPMVDIIGLYSIVDRFDFDWRKRKYVPNTLP